MPSSRGKSDIGPQMDFKPGAWGSVCNFDLLGVTASEAGVVCNQIFGQSAGVQIANSEFNWKYPNKGPMLMMFHDGGENAKWIGYETPTGCKGMILFSACLAGKIDK